MIEKLDGEVRVLAEYMSGISEEAYSASWMDGLEYALWYAVIHGPRIYGRVDITGDVILNLKKRSCGIDGWVYFDEVMGETFISREDWLILYRKNIEKYQSKIS